MQLHSSFSSYLSSVVSLAEVDPAQAADSWETLDARLDEVLFPASASPEATVYDSFSPCTDTTWVNSPALRDSPGEKTAGGYYTELPAVPEEPHFTGYASFVDISFPEAIDPLALLALPPDAQYAWNGVPPHAGFAARPIAMDVDAFAEASVYNSPIPGSEALWVDPSILRASPEDTDIERYFPGLPAVPEARYWYAHMHNMILLEAIDPLAMPAFPASAAHYAWKGEHQHAGFVEGPMTMDVDGFANTSAVAPISPVVPVTDEPTVPKQKGRKRKFAETSSSEVESVGTKAKTYVCGRGNCTFGESSHILVAVGSRLDASCARAASERKFNLTQHVNCVHDKVKPYPCKEQDCPRAFQRKNDAERHYQSAHTNLGSPRNPQWKGKLKAAKAAKSS